MFLKLLCVLVRVFIKVGGIRFSGECFNATPAGKRRISVQDNESAMAAAVAHDYHIYLSASALITMGCVGAILLFLIMFTFLQVSEQEMVF